MARLMADSEAGQGCSRSRAESDKSIGRSKRWLRRDLTGLPRSPRRVEPLRVHLGALIATSCLNAPTVALAEPFGLSPADRQEPLAQAGQRYYPG
jgi:hypothetical protein